MSPTRIPALLVIAGCCAVPAWLLLRLVYVTLPPLPWTVAPAMAALAAAEAWAGRRVRVRLRSGSGASAVDPIAVTRLAVLAQATARVAAGIGGVAAGFLGYLAGVLTAPLPRRDAIVSGVGLAAAVVLAVAALYLEHCCRVPPARAR